MNKEYIKIELRLHREKLTVPKLWSGLDTRGRGKAKGRTGRSLRQEGRGGGNEGHRNIGEYVENIYDRKDDIICRLESLKRALSCRRNYRGSATDSPGDSGLSRRPGLSVFRIPNIHLTVGSPTLKARWIIHRQKLTVRPQLHVKNLALTSEFSSSRRCAGEWMTVSDSAQAGLWMIKL